MRATQILDTYLRNHCQGVHKKRMMALLILTTALLTGKKLSVTGLRKKRGQIYFLPIECALMINFISMNTITKYGLVLLFTFSGNICADMGAVSCNEAYLNKQIEAAVITCTKEMNLGNVSAATTLAKILLMGPDKYRNNEKAFKLLTDSSNKLDPEAMIELANMYRVGVEPTKKDLNVAADLYKSAASNGNPIGLVNLGLLYLDDDYKFKPNIAYSLFVLAKRRGVESSYTNKIMIELEQHQNSESKQFIQNFVEKFDSDFPK